MIVHRTRSHEGIDQKKQRESGTQRQAGSRFMAPFCPGLKDDGSLDEKELTEWVEAVSSEVRSYGSRNGWGFADCFHVSPRPPEMLTVLGRIRLCAT